jgi:hypothetical protein
VVWRSASQIFTYKRTESFCLNCIMHTGFIMLNNKQMHSVSLCSGHNPPPPPATPNPPSCVAFTINYSGCMWLEY